MRTIKERETTSIKENPRAILKAAGKADPRYETEVTPDGSIGLQGFLLESNPRIVVWSIVASLFLSLPFLVLKGGAIYLSEKK